MADGNENMAPDAARTSAAADALGLAGASRAKAEAYLAEQIVVARAQAEVLRLQAEDLKREDGLRHWSLRVRHISDVMKLTFELAIAIIALVALIVIASSVWMATHDGGLVIDAFNVPTDMAARGLTGQVVAAQLQDKLSAMQNQTSSARPAASYSNNWGDDIKVEIPDTGVSIGETYRYLAKWLGHQTHITGEVFRTDTGIAVTARTGDDAVTVTGDANQLDGLLQQAAEAVYERTQPYRFASFLRQRGPSQFRRAIAIYQQLAVDGAPMDRLWAHVGLSALYARSDPMRAPSEAYKAVAIDPNLAIAQNDIYLSENPLGHDEAALAGAKASLNLYRDAVGRMTESARIISELITKASVAEALGAYAAAVRYNRQATQSADYNGVAETSRENFAFDLAAQHDARAARAIWATLPALTNKEFSAYRAISDVQLPYWMGDWPTVVARRQSVERALEGAIGSAGLSEEWADVSRERLIWPYVAIALAMTGDFSGADVLVSKTPRDCYICIRARARIAATEKTWKGADYWFANAVKRAPSIPFAYAEWGAMLMAKGDLDGAITKFESAHAKGPNFADPLEMWGEALIAKKRSDLALPRFEEADKYAPNWGRLHLKWGEALWWSGKRDDAKKQFAVASGLDLTPSEKSELTKVSHG